MNDNIDIKFIDLFKKLWKLVKPDRRIKLIFILILMIFASFFEIISISSFYPFLTVITNPDIVLQNKVAIRFINLLNINNKEQLILIFTIIFSFTMLISGGLRLILNWFQIKFSNLIGSDLSVNMYERALNESYIIHVSRNTSKIIDGIKVKANSVVNYVVLPILIIISSSLILTTILIILLYINVKATIITILIFAMLYLLFSRLTKKIINTSGEIISLQTVEIFKILRESLGGIRDILINNTQKIYINKFKNTDSSIRNSESLISIISIGPRFVVETFGLVTLAFAAYFIAIKTGISSKTIPILGMIALTAQRLLPIMNQIYSSIVLINGSRVALKEALELSDINQYLEEKQEKISFNNEIEIQNLYFKFNENSDFVIKNISIKIPKGSKIGIIGSSGSGKSTLVDIVMGLLLPTSGQLLIDNLEINEKNIKSWQQNISHVPQFIYLTDASVYENIAIGIPYDEIDKNRVKLVAKQSQILDIIEKLDHKFDSIIGEKGSRLSGGQRQRIGIARALYKGSSLLVLDEATSALDSDIENDVMNIINSLGSDYTVIIISHKITILNKCSQIIEIKNGQIINQSYKYLI